MVMPDAIDAIISLMNADMNKIISKVYHLNTFNPTPNEFYLLLKQLFPKFTMGYAINKNRQQMVDSWPMDLNCEKAMNEWNWNAKYDLEGAFSDYLIPTIKEKYNITV